MGDESFSQPPVSSEQEESTNRKRTRHHSENMWPKRNKLDESNTINALREGDWSSVESVTISRDTYPYHENIADTCVLSFLGTFKITCHTGNMNFEVKDIPSRRYYKAKLLWEQIFVMPRLQNIDNYKITYSSRGGLQTDSDSDGEDIPNPRSEPPFNEHELYLVNYLFKKLYESYLAAKAVGLFNCVGKTFIDNLGAFLDLCCSNMISHSSQFMYKHSTSTPGEAQPGAFNVKWSLKGKLPFKRERYSDNVIYDKVNVINVCNSEVKESPEVAIESQHNEQMIGLWKPSQKAMLGFEAQDQTLRPKVLTLDDDGFNMYYLKEMNLNNADDLRTVAKLMMMFLIGVVYC